MTAGGMFPYVFRLAKDISQETYGAFDITVAPLVKCMGIRIQERHKHTGTYHRQHTSVCRIRENRPYRWKNRQERSTRKCLTQRHSQRFRVDCVARLLDSKGVKNYMINIGGELVMKGENQNMESWRIGINKPIDDSLAVNQELQTVLEITNAGLATSGNYRNFYYKDGKKCAHTIDPRAGYPVQHNILSSAS